MTRDDDLIEEQKAYYRARAAEYDEWFERRGRYDHGDEHRLAWQQEVAEVRAALHTFRPAGKVIELAGGTGLWSVELLPHVSGLTVVDSSDEMLTLNRLRCSALATDLGVPYRTQKADIFRWSAVESYDVVFFSFWLSHVPESHFSSFWGQVRSALKPGGRCFFIDSQLAHQALATNHPTPDLDHDTAVRKLNDGRSYNIVKRFYDPAHLTERMQTLGFRASIRPTGNFFIYGELQEGEA